MLADPIEATVKSLPKPAPKRIEDIVADTIRKKIEDGQFDECDLTMRDIHAAGEAIREALIGFLGPRIAYPEALADKAAAQKAAGDRSEEHTSELQSRQYLVCRLLLEKKQLHHTPRELRV